MKEFMKKYYIYIAVGVVTIIALLLSIDLEKEPEINVPNIVSEQEVEDSFIYIDIRGSVLNPGVYKVESGTRLFQLITLAGGFIEDVKENVVNQSMLLEDEMFIYIPNIYDEVDDITSGQTININETVNINNATKVELESLPGIGPATAQSIIDYRNDIGEFGSVEDIMDVPGIGESTFNEIKALITV